MKKQKGKDYESYDPDSKDHICELPQNAILSGILKNYVEASVVEMIKFYEKFKENYPRLRDDKSILFANLPHQSINNSYDKSIFGYENGKYFVINRHDFTKYFAKLLERITNKEIRDAFIKTVEDLKNTK